MTQLTIRNIGPLVDVNLELNSVNVFIGPQGCGKSTISKIISFCCWLEKDCLIHMSTDYVDFDYIKVHLISFYRMRSYFRQDSYIEYESNAIKFVYSNGSVVVSKQEDFINMSVGKISYIPAERNVILLPNIGQIPLDADYLQSYIFDWLALRGRFDEGNAIGILNMGAEYYYDENQKRDTIRLNHSDDISLTEASSGIQSASPLYAYMQYLTSEIYRKKESISFEKQMLINNSVNSVTDDVLSRFVFEEKQYDQLEGLGEYRIVSGSEIDSRLEQIKENISKTHYARIIMEEPELSIFPQSQVAMVKDFLRMLNVERDMMVITTHSPYILYALNNYMLGWLVRDEILENDDTELIAQFDAFVDPRFVSVWEIRDGRFQSSKSYHKDTIQDSAGLIRENYFDRIMKDVMGDFNSFLSYYE